MNVENWLSVRVGMCMVALMAVIALTGCGGKEQANPPQSSGPKSNTKGADEPTITAKPLTNDERQAVTQITAALRQGDIPAAAAISKPLAANNPVFKAMVKVLEPKPQPPANIQETPVPSVQQPPPRIVMDGKEVDLFEVFLSPQTPAQVIVPFLFAPDQGTRWTAAGALERRGENVGVPELISIIETDSDMRMVEKSAWALSAIGDYRGREVLKKLSESPDPMRAKVGRVSLEKFGVGIHKSLMNQ